MMLPQLITLLVTFFMSLNIFSQKCEPYFPMREGVEFEITSYDEKDKFTF